ncbi:MAG: hypothetical protein IT329_06545, partial [Caldilineaceae bacterium]|nr:hypothetical protein [Caldilineaceae bacterium]
MMRDDPYPSRFYPRLEDNTSFGGDSAPVAGLFRNDHDLRRMFSFLLATYLLVALLFALTTQANAAPLNSAAAPAAWTAAGEGCGAMSNLATR